MSDPQLGYLLGCAVDLLLSHVLDGHPEVRRRMVLVPIGRDIAGRCPADLDRALLSQSTVLPSSRQRHRRYPRPLTIPSRVFNASTRADSRARPETAYLSQRLSTTSMRTRFSACKYRFNWCVAKSNS